MCKQICKNKENIGISYNSCSKLFNTTKSHTVLGLVNEMVNQRDCLYQTST